MKKLQNDTLQKFLDEVIEELKREKLTVTRVFPSGIFKSPESVFVSRPNSLKFILQENIKNAETNNKTNALIFFIYSSYFTKI